MPSLPDLRELLSVLDAGEKATARPWYSGRSPQSTGRHTIHIDPSINTMCEQSVSIGTKVRPDDGTYIVVAANVATRWARTFVEMWGEQKCGAQAAWYESEPSDYTEFPKLCGTCDPCLARAYLAQHPEEQA